MQFFLNVFVLGTSGFASGAGSNTRKTHKGFIAATTGIGQIWERAGRMIIVLLCVMDVIGAGKETSKGSIWIL
uniref:Uncharacterized protein n=1 Tax=viral metagenome TaxID=1070528 RepID=A0A6H1ZBV1_9ZZZZ